MDAAKAQVNQGERRSRGRSLVHLPYLAPAFLFIAALTLIPAGYTVYLSLTNASLLYPDQSFIGFGNYLRLLKDPLIRHVLSNTFVFVGGSVILQVGLGFGLALLLNLPYAGRVLVRTLLLATWVVPEVVVGFTWQLILAGGPNGLANSFLSNFGVEPVLFFRNGTIAMVVLIAVNVWRGTAFSMILMLAALQGIPKELYEAARIDGANSFQNLRFVTLPLVSATVLITLINNTLQTFNVTALVFALTGGGPARSTEVLALTMYQAAFGTYDLGYASAIAMLLFTINIALVIVYIVIFRKTSTEVAF